ncbi:MAG: T9SS type A sorting domain-containing protein [Microscillaceae bacterium]|nr:T9SS type A sorting domain-containing protein [Microscillaceae bacterium]
MHIFYTLSIIAGLYLLSPLLAQTRYVDDTGTNAANDCASPGNPCQTIQYAIDQALPGETIQISPGFYDQVLTINKSLTLQGPRLGVPGNDAGRTPADNAQEAILRNPNNNRTTGVLVSIQANDVGLDGLVLDGRDNFVQGITVNGFSNLTVRNLIIQNFDTDNTNANTQLTSAGIWATGNATGNLFENNLIRGIQSPLLTFAFAATPPSLDDFVLGTGIATQDGFYADARGNAMSDVVVGIKADNFTMAGQAVTFEDNMLTAQFQGIRLSNVGALASIFTLQNNTFSFTQRGYRIRITVPIFGNQNLDLPNSALNLASLAREISILDNEITGAYYGYVCFDMAPAANLVLDGGNITQVCQGVSVVNYDGVSSYAPSALTVQNITMTNFQGVATGSGLLAFIFDAYDFHAGIYTFNNSGSPNTATLEVNVENCRITGITRINRTNSAGIYAANLGTLPLTTLNVNNSVISNHNNHGLHLQLVQEANFTDCDISNNGNNDAFGVTLDRYGLNLRTNTTNVNFLRCHMQNPNAAYNIVGQPNSQMRAANCAITGGVISILTFDPPASGPKPNQNMSGCWWGSNANPNLGNDIDYSPWLNAGTDTDAVTRGFQGDFSFLRVGNTGFQFGGGRVQEGHDLLPEGGTLYLQVATFAENLNVGKSLVLDGIGALSLNNLTMNGAGRVLTLAQALTLPQTLTLTQGIIQNTNASLLRLTNNASGALLPATLSGQSWVNGYLARAISTGLFYQFPVGTATQMENAELRLNNQTGLSSVRAHFNATDPNTVATFLPFTENSLDYLTLFLDGYWEISPEAGTSANYDLSLFPSFIASNEGAIVKNGSASSDWLPDGVPDALPVGVGRLALNGFSNFAIASTSIALSTFYTIWESRATSEGLFLEWGLVPGTIFYELSLEHSTDGLHFQVLHTSENLSGTYLHQPSALPQWHYYRLKVQTPSSVLFSPVKAVYWPLGVGEWRVFPNPARECLWIETNLPAPSKLEICDLQGKILKKSEILQTKTQLNLENLRKGEYLLKLITNTGVFTKKILVY